MMIQNYFMKSLYSALLNDLSSIQFKVDGARYERRPLESDTLVHFFPQLKLDHSTLQVSVILAPQNDEAVVYFDGKFAYRVRGASKDVRFQRDLSKKDMKMPGEAAMIYFSCD